MLNPALNWRPAPVEDAARMQLILAFEKKSGAIDGGPSFRATLGDRIVISQ
jgi:hypothetical protein